MNNDLIKKIREIQQDTNLSSADKSKEIFKLMNPNFVRTFSPFDLIC